MHRLPPDFAPLLEAATCLENLMQIFDEGPVRLPDATVQRCWELYARFCEMTDHLDELLLPKRHLFAHLLEGLGFRGNPKFYANWRDEGLNKLLRSSCRHQSQSTFDSSLLVRMDSYWKMSSKDTSSVAKKGVERAFSHECEKGRLPSRRQGISRYNNIIAFARRGSCRERGNHNL